MRMLRNVTTELWWDVARNCEYATFYHTPIWKEVTDRLFPGRYRNETIGAILPSGVRVVLPLTSTRQIGPVRWIDSTAMGVYGGLIADGPVSPSEASQIYKQAYAGWSTASLYIVDNPLGGPKPESLQSMFNLVYTDAAYAIALDADFDTIFSRFQRTQRKDYRRGVKRGVAIRLADSVDDYRIYYPIYRGAVKRWGEGDSYGFNQAQFEHIYQLSLRYPENIKLWLMTLGEQVVGGTIVFYWGSHALAWNGTVHCDFLDYEVMPVGDTEMIRDAITRGYSYFDFSTCHNNQGLIEYKKRFGSVATPICGWLYENPLLGIVRSTYSRINKHPLIGRMQSAYLRLRESTSSTRVGLATGFAMALLEMI